MNVASIYNRLVYRDLLGYVLPGSFLLLTIVISISPITIDGVIIDPLESFSIIKLLIVLGFGFILGHLVAVLPRQLLRIKIMRKKQIDLAIKSNRIVDVQELLKLAFARAYGENAWDKYDNMQRRNLMNRWIQAHNLYTDMLNRIESVRIFLENSTFVLPLSMVLISRNIAIGGLSEVTSATILIGLAVALGILSFGGCFNLCILEEREVVYVFVDDYIRSQKECQISL